MKAHIAKGIISAGVSILLFVILATIMNIFIDNGCFDQLYLFPPNVFGIIIIVLSLLIPLVFCRFQKFAELLVYSISFPVSIIVVCIVFFIGCYAINYILEYTPTSDQWAYSWSKLWTFSWTSFASISYNLIYMSLGIMIGFVCSIVTNTIRNISAKKNIKIDDI